MRRLRWVLLGLVLLLGWLQYRLWFGIGSAGEVAALEAQVQHQDRENGGLHERNAALAAEVRDLKEGVAAVEERARSELGMIKPGEVFYRVVEDPEQRTQPAAENAPAGAPASSGAPAAAPAPATTAPAAAVPAASGPAASEPAASEPPDAGEPDLPETAPETMPEPAPVDEGNNG